MVKARTGRHRAGKGRRIEPYAWLGAGAVALGIGAASLAGSGIAAADDTGAEATSKTSVEDRREANDVDAQPQSGSSGSIDTTVREDISGSDDEESTLESDGENEDLGDADEDAQEADAQEHRDSHAKTDSEEPEAAAEEEDDVAATTAIDGTREPAHGELDEPATVPSSDSQPVSGVTNGSVQATAAAHSEQSRRADTPAIAALNSSAGQANTAPTVTSVRVSPGLFTSKVYARITANDPDGDKLSFGVMSLNSIVSIRRWGSTANIAYTPSDAARHAAAAPNGPKTETLQITVHDGFGGVVTTSITVDIKPANTRPSARVRAVKTNPANGVVTGAITASDRDGDALAFSGSGSTPRGNVVLNPDGTFVYTPTADALNGAASIFARSDRFAVTVTDGHGGSRTLDVRVSIPRPGSNRAPSLGTPLFTVTGVFDSNGQVVGQINAADPEGFGLIYRLNTGIDPNVGAASVTNTGAFQFVPTLAAREAAFRSPGEDTAQFSAVVTDGGAPVVVTITVPISAKAPAPPPPPPPPSPSLIRPLSSYRITQEYGGAHTGIDLAANTGTPVYASGDGVIYHEGWGTSDRAGKPSDWMGKEAGISILIRHDGLGIMTGYAHLSRTIIDVGQRVTKGQLIGYVGSTGLSSGPHLHFEVLPLPLNSSRGILGRVNPRNYVSL